MQYSYWKTLEMVHRCSEETQKGSWCHKGACGRHSRLRWKRMLHDGYLQQDTLKEKNIY